VSDPISLDDYDRKILLDCPATIIISKRPTRIEAAKMKRVRRLWTSGLVNGTVGDDGRSLKVTLRNAGRLAIGRPAIEGAV
jgi:hypothetical protein